MDLGAHRAEPGDAILVNGLLGDHGAAILAARGDLRLNTSIESDCAPLNSLIDALIDACPQVKFMRDATRGGLATVLNEIAEASGVGIEIEERKTPLREEVKGFCEILGLVRFILPMKARSSRSCQGIWRKPPAQPWRRIRLGAIARSSAMCCKAPPGVS